MDINSLKALAERLESFLDSKGHSIKHGQALELMSAIPGLRNWSEVMAFPDRVAAATVTEHSVQRLCSRLMVKRKIQQRASDLLAVLTAADHEHNDDQYDYHQHEHQDDESLIIWPDGPARGIYVSTDNEAVKKAIGRFTQHDPDAVIYCESAWSDIENAIDLGDAGIFSRGLRRAPRGTLIVVGPVEMTQEYWEANGDRMRAAANHAISAGHRIVVYVKTLVANRLHFDVARLVRWNDSPPVYVDDMLRGDVTEDGQLLEVQPFVAEPSAPVVKMPTPSVEFPPILAAELRDSMRVRQNGIVVICEAHHKDQHVYLEAALPFVACGRPVARIVPQLVLHYGSDEPLSPYFQGVPLCSSIESAYAQGYRVMVVERGYDREAQDELLKYSAEVCFLLGSFGPAQSAVFQALPSGFELARRIEEILICILCMAKIEAQSGTYWVHDAFVPHKQGMPANDIELFEYVAKHRAVRWEEAVKDLLERGLATPKEVQDSLRGYSVDELSKLLKRRRKPSKRAKAQPVD